MRATAALLLPLLCTPLSPARADVVHLVGEFAVQGVVKDQGEMVSVATPAGVKRFPRESVLFVERTSDPARRQSVIQRASILLHRIGDSAGTREMDALAGLAAMEPGDLFRPLLDALRYHRAEVRRYAAFRLGLLGSYEALDPLVERSLRDPDDGVRKTAFEGVRRIGHPKLAVPYIRSLRSDNSFIRIGAANALGEIGDDRAVKYLIQAIALPPASPGGSPGIPNAVIFSGSEIAYVKDFDVAVAQNAAAADPVVGTAIEGALLDARVIGVTVVRSAVEMEAITTALGRLTGKSFGTHTDAWLLWWNTQGSKAETTQR